MIPDPSWRVAVDTSNNNPDPLDWYRAGQMIQAAYFKASQGVSFEDGTYYRRMNDARKQRLLIGPYHFFESKYDTPTQAGWFFHCAGWNPAWLPPMLDVEEVSLDPHVGAGVAVVRIIGMLQAIADKTKTRPVLYTNPDTWGLLGQPEQIAKYADLWVASYDIDRPQVLQGFTDWVLWQYTDSLQVPGLGAVDGSYVKPEWLTAHCGGEGL